MNFNEKATAQFPTRGPAATTQGRSLTPCLTLVLAESGACSPVCSRACRSDCRAAAVTCLTTWLSWKQHQIYQTYLTEADQTGTLHTRMLYIHWLAQHSMAVTTPLDHRNSTYSRRHWVMTTLHSRHRPGSTASPTTLRNSGHRHWTLWAELAASKDFSLLTIAPPAKTKTPTDYQSDVLYFSLQNWVM